MAVSSGRATQILFLTQATRRAIKQVVIPAGTPFPLNDIRNPKITEATDAVVGS